MLLHPAFLLLIPAALGLVACTQPSDPPEDEHAPGTFSIMTYQLDGFGMMDRDGDGLANDPLPTDRRQAVLSVLATHRPDVAVFQGMGRKPEFRQLIQELADLGLSYEHTAHVSTPHSPGDLSLASRFPLENTTFLTQDVYTVSSETIPVRHGYLRTVIRPSEDCRFVLFAADLKSQTYHPLGQTEMRRNEGRMLSNHIRSILREDPDAAILVAGSFHDHIGSAALREVTGNRQEWLTDAPITDAAGDRWTGYDAEEETYRREDFLLLSTAMETWLEPHASFIVRSRTAGLASAHRPVIGVFSCPTAPVDP